MAAFDLDAVAAEAAGVGEAFQFTFGGDTYEMPPRIDVRAVALLSKGELLDAIKVMLGPDQTTRLMGSDAVMNDAVFSALIEAYAAHQATTTGESSASTTSSSNTAERSRPTSNVSTVSH